MAKQLPKKKVVSLCAKCTRPNNKSHPKGHAFKASKLVGVTAKRVK